MKDTTCEVIMKKNLVKVYRGSVLCDSRIIAEKFKKQHKHVLGKIDKLRLNLENLTAQGVTVQKIKFPLLFEEKKYLSRGQTYRYIEMNKPAFSLLVMEFSGSRAFNTKLLFNDAFYQMEQALLRQDNLEWKGTREQGKQIRQNLTDEIKTFVDYAIAQGSQNASKYYILITKMQYKALKLIEKNEKIDKNFRNTLDMMDLNHLIAAENVARKALMDGIAQELHYKDIFQLAKANVLQLANIMVIKPQIIAQPLNTADQKSIPQVG